MKKLVFGIGLLVFGGILIGASLIAGGLFSAGLNPSGLTSFAVGIFEDAGVIAFTVIGAIFSLAGIFVAVRGLKT